MNIAVIGLGYVGCVALVKFAEEGHTVIGVDKNISKVDQVNKKTPTIVESGIEEYFANPEINKNFSAITNIAKVVDWADIYYVCVGTPNKENGDLNLNNLFKVINEIKVLKKSDDKKILVIRSTVKPGTNKLISNDLVGSNINVVSNPEFLREGNAISDWDNSEQTVIGTNDPVSGKIIAELYNSKNTLFVEPETAEFIKYVNNSWHATKVAFANEVGRIAKSQNIKINELFDLFTSEKKLNISNKYLLPGMPYGGSCLTKDLKALTFLAEAKDISFPLLKSVSKSNKKHIEYLLNKIEKNDCKKISIYGITFKSNTDDLRFSPALEIVEKLILNGHEVKIFDESINNLLLKVTHNNHLLIEKKYLCKHFVKDYESLYENTDIVVLFHKLNETRVYNDKVRILKAYNLDF